jgi:hypothetical protein
MMKTLLLAALLCAGCTLPQVIYVNQPYPDADYWNMPASRTWVTDPMPMQPVKIPQWCRNPISHTVDPC